MTRKEDLEGHIRDSYDLIREYEDILRLSDRPKEKARARSSIEEQWDLIGEYLGEYLSLCRRIDSLIPSSIREIAARFEAVSDKKALPEIVEPPPESRSQGTTYITHIDHAEGIAIGDGAQVVQSEHPTSETAAPPGVGVTLLTEVMPTAFCHQLTAEDFPLVVVTLDNTGQGCANAAFWSLDKT